MQRTESRAAYTGGMSTQSLPDWLVPPRPEGWFADDLDHLPQAPEHTELWDGALIFNMSPQREWHRIVIRALEAALSSQTPPGIRAIGEMTIKLGDRTRPEPDVLLITAPPDRNRTFFHPDEVSLVVEVVSPDSEDRDRHTKPARYAAAGIGCFWLVEEDQSNGKPVVHVYELDETTHTYVATQIARGTLRTTSPFEIEIDLDQLYP